MVRGQAQIETPLASRYLMQLCKHFRHKVPAEFDEHNGRVDFPFGLCIMKVDNEKLTMDCESETTEAFLRMQFVLNDHVKRFAWKENLELVWQSDVDE